jgi:BirA family biotin operon repressor/biotin-[acetyl-CoA-carboxylase] ligase
VARVAIDGVPASELAHRWGVPQCALFHQIPSTLDAIHELGARGAAGGATVIAEEQTAGRGRDGRTWHSPEGGVWLGMLLRPPLARVELGAVSIRAGLALADAVDGLLGAPAARLKWPNDVLLDDRKLAGIVCEGRWQGDRLQWLAVGVGVNVCNPAPAAVARTAIALKERLPGARRMDLLDRLVPALTRITSGGPLLSERECAAFAARDWLRGREIRSPATGRARGLRADGALLVDLGAGAETIVVRQGHVELA